MSKIKFRHQVSSHLVYFGANGKHLKFQKGDYLKAGPSKSMGPINTILTTFRSSQAIINITKIGLLRLLENNLLQNWPALSEGVRVYRSDNLLTLSFWNSQFKKLKHLGGFIASYSCIEAPSHPMCHIWGLQGHREPRGARKNGGKIFINWYTYIS